MGSAPVTTNEVGHQLCPGHPQPLPSGARGTLCSSLSPGPLPLLTQDSSGTKVPLQFRVWIQVSRKWENEQKNGIEFFYNNSEIFRVSRKDPQGKPHVACSLSKHGRPRQGQAETCTGHHKLREGRLILGGGRGLIHSSQDGTPL